MPALRSAIVLSRLDLYSGVNVAQTSTPSADQAIRNSHTRQILIPPHWWLASVQWTLDECQSPAITGPKIRTHQRDHHQRAR